MRLCTVMVLSGLIAISHQANAANLSPDPRQWHPLVLDVAGPSTSESDVSPHPFMDYRLDITFTSPTGTTYVVPGFFAGNGKGHGEGSIWRARFTPDEPGNWQWEVAFHTGDRVAIASPTELHNASPIGEHGNTGVVQVAERDASARGLQADGRLEYIGEHYLKQADGDFWIKGGVDSPENFFGYAGFDNTVDQPGGVATPDLENGLHRYTPHVDHWRLGDPDFISHSTGVNSHGIIGAINYLSALGVNSIYLLPMNLGGDGRDTYPFINASGTDFDNTRYDVSKLFQWNLVLNHMQEKGIAAHLVLAEQEVGNTEWLDQGQLGPQRKLFFRELVARFSYLNGVKWNLSEESRFGSALEIQMAEHIRSLDWAAHPIAVHTHRDLVDTRYEPLLGQTEIDSTSIQFSAENAEVFTETWRESSRAFGVPWVIDLDEVGPAGVGLTDNNIDELRKQVLYPTYFSGGNLEWYFGYHRLPLGGDMQTEDFSTREPMYRYMRIARDFLQDNVPLDRAQPADERLSGGIEGDQLFGIPDQVFAGWFADGRGDRTLTVGSDDTAQWQLQWFDPQTGVYAGAPTVAIGSSVQTGSAPRDVTEDWMFLATRISSVEPTNIMPVTSVPTTEQAAPPPDQTIAPVTDTGGEEIQPETAAAVPVTAVVSDDGGGGAGGFPLTLLATALFRLTRSNRTLRTERRHRNHHPLLRALYRLARRNPPMHRSEPPAGRPLVPHVKRRLHTRPLHDSHPDHQAAACSGR